MKRLLSILLTVLTVLAIVPIGISAEEMISFMSPQGAVFTTEYSTEEYQLVKTEDDHKYVYAIYDVSGFVESWEFDKETPIQTRADAYSNMRYTNRKSVGAFSGQLVHEVVLWTSRTGSFYQYESLSYDHFSIEGWSYYSLGNYSSAVNPQNGKWPTMKVNVSYTCSVIATISLNLEASIGGELLEADFSFSGSAGGDITYTKNIINSYSIALP